MSLAISLPAEEKPLKFSMLKTHEKVFRVKGVGYYLKRYRGREFLGKHPRTAESRLQMIERQKNDYSLATPHGLRKFKQRLFCAMVIRARKAEQACMTLDEFGVIWNRARGRCELTGMEFSVEKFGQCIKRPWAPSIDRRDNSRGYEYDNCRLVCTAVNLALNEFGDEVLLSIARALRNGGKL